MGIPSFTQGYPQDGSSLGSSKSVIRDNLDGTFQVFSVDHQDQNETNAGYHSVIHQQTQGSKPATISGVNQLFSMIPGTAGTPNIPPNGDTQLYSKTGMGGFSQLTGSGNSFSGSPVVGSGYVWCSGMLMQYGIVANGATSITFPVAFPTACFNVQMTPQGNGGTFSINPKNVTTAGCGINVNGSSANYQTYYWFAIGN